MIHPKSGNAKVVVIVLAVVVGFLCVCGGLLTALLLPAVQQARLAARRAQSMNNMRQIGIALHNYHAVYNCMPKAVMTNDDGVEHSWRVAILPFLDQQQLHGQYDTNETWDSPKNRQVLEQMPPVFDNPNVDLNANPNSTTYLAIAGPKSVLNTEDFIGLRNIVAGTANTILLVDATNNPTPWTKPDELSPEEFTTMPSFDTLPGGTMNVLTTDGAVQIIEQQGRGRADRMLSIDGQ